MHSPNNKGQTSLDVDSKKEAWKEHYMHLLNVEFSWNPGGLFEVYPLEGPSEHITKAMVRKTINKISLEQRVLQVLLLRCSRPQVQVVLV